MERLVAVLRVPVVQQRTAEWYAKRMTRITASEAASILGENPYESATDVLFKKSGLGKPFTGNAATQYGQRHEPDAIAAYCAALGRVSFEVGLIDHAAVHGAGALAFLAGSPDGIAVRAPRGTDASAVAAGSAGGATLAGVVGPRGADADACAVARADAASLRALLRAEGEGDDVEPTLLEVKCPYRRRIVHGTVPRHYYAQVQLNMLICGLTTADFVEYRPGAGGGCAELNVVRVYPDGAWLARAIPVLRAFHEECARYAAVGIEAHPEYAKYARNARPPRPLAAVLETLASADCGEAPACPFVAP
jgi:putative phage-type endonuclease